MRKQPQFKIRNQRVSHQKRKSPLFNIETPNFAIIDLEKEIEFENKEIITFQDVKEEEESKINEEEGEAVLLRTPSCSHSVDSNSTGMSSSLSVCERLEMGEIVEQQVKQLERAILCSSEGAFLASVKNMENIIPILYDETKYALLDLLRKAIDSQIVPVKITQAKFVKRIETLTLLINKYFEEPNE